MDFFSLSAQQFEDMCFDYTCKLYSNKKNYKLTHTRFNHDGGRDIEITFYDELSHFKIWAECKRHRNNIGLEEIGKNVVLVISKHINKLMFFSASDITLSARTEISRVGEAFGFEVVYLYGEFLKKALQQYPDIIAKYFPYENLNNSSCTTLDITFSISELEQDIIMPIEGLKPILLRDGRMINLYIQIKNLSDDVYSSVLVELQPISEYIYFGEVKKHIEMIMPKSDRFMLFQGQIINQHISSIPMPEVLITLNSNGTFLSSYSLPDLDASKCKKYPLIGKDVNNFLTHVSSAIEWCNYNYTHVFDIRGGNGVGKSRLATEISNKFVLHGFETIKYDCRDSAGTTLLHKILCGLLGIPFYRGEINFSKEDIKHLIEKAGGSLDFQKIISEFLVENKISDRNLYYLQNAFLYYLMHPPGENKFVVVLDNVQNLDNKILNFFINILDVINECASKTVMIFITNTEREAYDEKKLKSFLDFMEHKHKNFPHNFSYFECKPFSKEDATLLLMHLFEIQDSNSSCITEFIKKSGYKPFEIIQFLEYMSDRNIIEWLNNKLWYIKKQDEFIEFLNGCPLIYESIIEERIKYLKEKFSRETYNDFKDVITALICFQGIIPYNFLYYLELQDEIIEIMKTSLWISENATGITFFHDNMYYYFKDNRLFCKNIPLLQKILTVIETIQTDEISNIQQKNIQFFCLYHQGKFKAALTLGLEIIEKNNCLIDDKQTAINIAETLLSNKLLLDDEVKYIKVYIAYANLIFEIGQKDKGHSIYAEVVPLLMKNKKHFSSEFILKHLHKMVNAQLQLAYYDGALNTLALMESYSDSTDEYKFIIKNRYGVVHTCRGDFLTSERNLLESLEIAKTLHSDFWMSTSYSDMGLRYFYDYTIDNLPRKQLVCDNLEKAVLLFNQEDNNPTYRVLEMYWHKAIISILDTNYTKAYLIADECIKKGKEYGQLYNQVRGYNLKALVCLYENNYDEALALLLDCFHICEISNFSSGIFRMNNNLGVLQVLKNDTAAAESYFLHALNTLDYTRIDIKQYPAILNLLIAATQNSNTKIIQQVDLICNQIKSPILTQYKVNIKKALQEKSNINNMSFWHFEGYGFIF